MDKHKVGVPRRGEVPGEPRALPRWPVPTLGQGSSRAQDGAFACAASARGSAGAPRVPHCCEGVWGLPGPPGVSHPVLPSRQVFQKELGKRASCIKMLKRSVRDLTRGSSSVDSQWLQQQMEELSARWDLVCKLSVSKQARLEAALRQVRAREPGGNGGRRAAQGLPAWKGRGLQPEHLLEASSGSIFWKHPGETSSGSIFWKHPREAC